MTSCLLQCPGRALPSNSPPASGTGQHRFQGPEKRRLERAHGDGRSGGSSWNVCSTGQQQLNPGLGLGLGFGMLGGGASLTSDCAPRGWTPLHVTNVVGFSGEKKGIVSALGTFKFPWTSPSSSSRRMRRRRQGRVCARNEHRPMHSRNVKVALISKLIRLGGADSGDGGGDGGFRRDGGDGGDDGGDDAGFSSPDGGGFSFFSGLWLLLWERCKSGMWPWAVSAFLAGIVMSSLDCNDCAAHARAFSGSEELAGKAADAEDAIWEVKGSNWKRFVSDPERDEFVFDVSRPSEEEATEHDRAVQKKDGNEARKPISLSNWLRSGNDFKASADELRIWAAELMKRIFLPAGFPGSVTEGYMEFTTWRLGQIIASQISGVLTTQALLYAVGLGRGAIPTAAAINWVLRDGIGYLSKIMLSKYGRHFDVHPKGWRLVSDIIENASYGLELVTPVVPHLFVYLAAVAGAGRSAAGMIQAATKSCFTANFAAHRNFAEIIARGEAQGMASKSVGIGLGILISGYVGSRGPLLVITFGVTSALHIFFNLKSYQAVHLRTLNPYRASLVLAEYLNSGTVPSVKDVNNEEPIFFGKAWSKPMVRRGQSKLDTVSSDSKKVASALEKNVELGVSLATVVRTKGESDALMHLYSKDKYLLAVQGERIKVVLKDGASAQDMFRAIIQAVYLQRTSKEGKVCSENLISDCKVGGILHTTHDLMEKNWDSIARVLSEKGWVTNGVVARAAPNRLISEYQTLQSLDAVTA